LENKLKSFDQESEYIRRQFSNIITHSLQNNFEDQHILSLLYSKFGTFSESLGNKLTMNVLVTQLQIGSNKDFHAKIACLKGITHIAIRTGKIAVQMNFTAIII